MSKPKRYETEQQITDKIDQLRKSIPGLIEGAEQIIADADAFFRSINDKTSLSLIDDWKVKKRWAKAAQRRALTIETKTIPRLVRTLAAFRMETMPFLPDRAVMESK